MLFELGKCYKRVTGEEIQIVKTSMNGVYCIGISTVGEYTLIKIDEEHCINWEQISFDEYIKHSKGGK